MGFNPSSMKIDPVLAEEGVWVEIDEGAQIKVARINNSKHRKLLTQLRLPYRSYELSGRPLPEDKLKEISVEVTAQTILLDWKGITGDDGQPIPFTVAAAKEALTVEQFMLMVLNFANEVSLFKGATKDEQIKNSPPSSIGKSPTEGAA